MEGKRTVRTCYFPSHPGANKNPDQTGTYQRTSQRNEGNRPDGEHLQTQYCKIQQEHDTVTHRLFIHETLHWNLNQNKCKYFCDKKKVKIKDVSLVNVFGYCLTWSSSVHDGEGVDPDG